MRAAQGIGPPSGTNASPLTSDFWPHSHPSDVMGFLARPAPLRWASNRSAREPGRPRSGEGAIFGFQDLADAGQFEDVTTRLERLHHARFLLLARGENSCKKLWAFWGRCCRAPSEAGRSARLVADHSDPLTIGAFRFGIGFVVQFPIALLESKPWPDKRDWPAVVGLRSISPGPLA